MSDANECDSLAVVIASVCELPHSAPGTALVYEVHVYEDDDHANGSNEPLRIVYREYEHFERLHAACLKHYDAAHLPPFPRRGRFSYWFGLSPDMETMQMYAAVLSQYLNELLQNARFVLCRRLALRFLESARRSVPVSADLQFAVPPVMVDAAPWRLEKLGRFALVPHVWTIGGGDDESSGDSESRSAVQCEPDALIATLRRELRELEHFRVRLLEQRSQRRRQRSVQRNRDVLYHQQEELQAMLRTIEALVADNELAGAYRDLWMYMSKCEHSIEQALQFIEQTLLEYPPSADDDGGGDDDDDALLRQALAFVDEAELQLASGELPATRSKELAGSADKMARALRHRAHRSSSRSLLEVDSVEERLQAVAELGAASEWQRSPEVVVEEFERRLYAYVSTPPPLETLHKMLGEIERFKKFLLASQKKPLSAVASVAPPEVQQASLTFDAHLHNRLLDVRESVEALVYEEKKKMDAVGQREDSECEEDIAVQTDDIFEL